MPPQGRLTFALPIAQQVVAKRGQTMARQPQRQGDRTRVRTGPPRQASQVGMWDHSKRWARWQWAYWQGASDVSPLQGMMRTARSAPATEAPTWVMLSVRKSEGVKDKVSDVIAMVEDPARMAPEVTAISFLFSVN